MVDAVHMKASDTTALNSRTRQPVNLTRMGFGGAPLGNLYRKISEDNAQSALQAAFDAGIRFFDTAPQYGLGRSEMRFNPAIQRFGRQKIKLSTKVGRLLEDCTPEEVTPEAFVDVSQKCIVYDYTYDGIMKSFETSKERLGVSEVDLLFVHDVDVFTHGSQEASDAKVRELFEERGYHALEELRNNGDILAIGAGVNEWQVCQRLMNLGDFDCFLLAGRYTLLEQDALETFLPSCLKRDVGIILGGPYNSGILATGPVAGAKYNYIEAPKDILNQVGKIDKVCHSHGVRLIEAALQFVFGHPAVKSVIPGASNASEVEENVSILESRIPAQLWSDLQGEGLIRSDAPISKEMLNVT